jgi:hypothetical protein
VQRAKRRKQFFFEKKNQKTFMSWRAAGKNSDIKVFCFFSSEKKVLLPQLDAQSPERCSGWNVNASGRLNCWGVCLPLFAVFLKTEAMLTRRVLQGRCSVSLGRARATPRKAAFVVADR